MTFYDSDTNVVSEEEKGLKKRLPKTVVNKQAQYEQQISLSKGRDVQEGGLAWSMREASEKLSNIVQAHGTWGRC